MLQSLWVYRYCVEFEVMKVSKACQKTTEYNKMIEGDRIIVWCDNEAFSPDEKVEDPAKENEICDPVNTYSKSRENETYEKDEREAKPVKYRCSFGQTI